MFTNKATPPIRAPIPTKPVCAGLLPAWLLLVDGPPVVVEAWGVAVATAAVALLTEASSELSADSTDDASAPVETDESLEAREDDNGPAAEVMLAMSLETSPATSPAAAEIAVAALEAALAMFDATLPTSDAALPISEPMALMMSRGLASGAKVTSGSLGATGFAY